MFGNPEQNVAKLVLHEGMRVADFGAGTGAYTIACSKRVGNTGKVYSIEVQKGLLKRLEDELKKLKILSINKVIYVRSTIRSTINSEVYLFIEPT